MVPISDFDIYITANINNDNTISNVVLLSPMRVFILQHEHQLHHHSYYNQSPFPKQLPPIIHHPV